MAFLSRAGSGSAKVAVLDSGGREWGIPAMADSFGDLLRRFRVAASLTQEALAEQCRISPATVAAIEQGRRNRTQAVDGPAHRRRARSVRGGPRTAGDGGRPGRQRAQARSRAARGQAELAGGRSRASGRSGGRPASDPHQLRRPGRRAGGGTRGAGRQFSGEPGRAGRGRKDQAGGEGGRTGRSRVSVRRGVRRPGAGAPGIHQPVGGRTARRHRRTRPVAGCGPARASGQGPVPARPGQLRAPARRGRPVRGKAAGQLRRADRPGHQPGAAGHPRRGRRHGPAAVAGQRDRPGSAGQRPKRCSWTGPQASDPRFAGAARSSARSAPGWTGSRWRSS